MIDLNYIKNFYPAHIAEDPSFHRHLVKEYIEVMALDFLASTEYIDKLAFIGGTNLRLVKGIDRFSEDLDFDCSELSEAEFVAMTDLLISFFRNNGLQAEARDKENPKLTAYRRNIHFPQLLFDLGLTAHREQRFLLKVETQDQGIAYTTKVSQISRCGYVLQVPTPPDDVLLSMKLSALLSRAKGRDFYDVMFLWQQTEPNYDFLSQHEGISNKDELLTALDKKLDSTDLEMKTKDFAHLLFTPGSAKRILQFRDFIHAK